MMSKDPLIICLFIGSILIYIAFFHKSIEIIDILLIITSLFILSCVFFKNNNIESFQDTIQTYTASNKIQIEEEFGDLNNACVLYTTVFNSNSYAANSTSPQIWNCIINPQTFSLNFSSLPLFSQLDGLFLGNNTLKGPEANQLGINFLSVYTLLIVCKHGDLPDNNANDIELLKLYATSDTSPNALTLKIAANSINTVNNVQVGNLQLVYADQPPQSCLVNNTDTSINFDKNVLTFYFIVKESTSFKIKILTEVNSSIVKIFDYQPNNTKINFANNSIRINRLANWNAHMYSFAVFNQNLADDDITQTYNHIMNEYMKFKDPNFPNIISTYNNAVDTLTNITQCPFNSVVCNNCQTVQRWYNVNDVVNSSQQCRMSIDTYCKANKNNSWCSCWDANSVNYNLPNCKLFRSIYSGTESLLDTLTDAELLAIKNKYGLVESNKCDIQLNQGTLQPTRDVAEPSDDEIEVKIPLEDLNPNLNKRPVLDYYQKNIMPLNQPEFTPSVGGSTIVDPGFDMSGMKMFNAQSQQSQPTIGSGGIASSPYFDKFLKVLMPS